MKCAREGPRLHRSASVPVSAGGPRWMGAGAEPLVPIQPVRKTGPPGQSDELKRRATTDQPCRQTERPVRKSAQKNSNSKWSIGYGLKLAVQCTRQVHWLQSGKNDKSSSLDHQSIHQRVHGSREGEIVRDRGGTEASYHNVRLHGDKVTTAGSGSRHPSIIRTGIGTIKG